METITAALCRTLLPRRSRDGHKGTFGKVAVVGGAVGYTGAPVYAGEAAARTGSGLVFAGVPEEVYPIVAARCGASMAYPLPRDYAAAREKLEGCDAVLLGPGLGSEAAARELASRGITVNAIAPGYIATDMTAALPEKTREAITAQIPLGRVGNPEEVAAAAVFLASDLDAYITGQVLSVDGGMYM